MTHLLDALERGEDIGHYGRLTFAMVAHRFLKPAELVGWLAKGEGCDETEAKALAQQMSERDYNPPSRERIFMSLRCMLASCGSLDEPCTVSPARAACPPQPFAK